MDRKQLIVWIGGIVARGIAWFLAVKLGMDAAESDSLGQTIAEALGALTLAGLSIYSSVKGRKKLLTTPVGEQAGEPAARSQTK